ncbi:MAG: rhomboid family intramembrane serine protease, partial [Acidimicrobiales bacterium]
VHTASSMFGGRPIVTQTLLFLNLAVFALSVVNGDGFTGQVAVDGWLVEGSAWGPAIDVLDEWWRVVTSGFLHFGIFHVAFNMYALWLFGPTFERSLGRLRFSLVYGACLLGGSFGALLVTPNAATAGASGAIFGLLGIAVVSHRSIGISIWDSGLGTVLILNFALTFGVGGISVGGHVGGFLVGLACGWLCYDLPRRVKMPKGSIEAIIVLIGALCFAGALWAASTWMNPIF